MRSITGRRIQGLTQIATVLLLLVMGSRPQNALALTQVTLVEGPGFFTGTPTVFAAENGIFEKHGLEVKFVTIAAATTALEAVRNGQADLSWAGSTAVTRGLKGSKDVKMVGQHMTKPFFILVARPEIKSFNDLRGKIVSGSAPGNAEQTMTLQVLQNHGLKPGDYQYQVMNVPQRFPALKNNLIQAAPMVPPYNMTLVSEGYTRLVDYDDELPLWMSGSTVVRAETIKNNPQMIKNFLRALKEAIEIIQKDKERAVAFWMKRHKVPRAAAALAYDKYAGTFKLDPNIEPVKNQWNFAARQLKISNPPPVESIIDFSILKEVLAE